MYKWKAYISKLLQYRPGWVFYCGQLKSAFSILGKVDLDSSALQLLNIQQRAVLQLEKLFKLNSISFM